jgi:4-carboxymuconolactone decarboxylase
MIQPEKEFFSLEQTDPEFAGFFSRFMLQEVPRESKLDDTTRTLAILAALLGVQGEEAFSCIVEDTVGKLLSATEIKELVYQGTAYLGFGKTLPFLRRINEIFMKKGIALPLEKQGTTTEENRVETGNQAQVAIFGEQLRDFQNSGPEESRHINRWLAGNCFGDYYTRGGLDFKQREMITFCFLAAQGGCEPQLLSHIAANFHVGNNKAFLIDVLSQCLPYIGYPRSLNALRCINEASA